MKVFLDANIFVKAWVVDVVMCLADDGFLDPVWSETVLEEAAEAICAVRGCPRSSADAYLAAVQRFYPEGLVGGWEPLVELFDLPDADDCHVAAAAAYTHCDMLLTFNVRDFPQETMADWGIDVVTPDDLAMMCVDVDRDAVAGMMVRLTASKRRPPRTLDAEAAGLLRSGLPRFSEFVRGLSQ